MKNAVDVVNSVCLTSEIFEIGKQLYRSDRHSEFGVFHMIVSLGTMCLTY